ncbi:hypothetical protein V1264_005727 [Littorina saxatilis]|uniref:Endonuclease n=1 Tax=Littorina saxatilis TaxID=31220 RepID=A0AAN9B267_9CAEN
MEVYDGMQFNGGENKKDINVVLQKFQDFCVGSTHEAFETYKFHTRNQDSSESIEAYVAALRKLAKTCNFEEMEDRMLRDRIVVGVKSDVAREKLLEDSTLNFKKAVDVCRAYETSQQQLQVMSKDASVDRFTSSNKSGSRPTGKQRPHKSKSFQYTQNPTSPRQSHCSRCGRTPPHNREACPAKNAKCHQCSKVGHYATVCRSSNIQTVEEEEGAEAYLGSVVGEVTSDKWQITVKIEGADQVFKIDTGADVTVIPDNLVPSSKRPLEKAGKKLFGPGRAEMSVVGKFKGKITYKQKTAIQDVFVVKGLEEPLLGRPAITALKLVERVSYVAETLETSSKRQYPKLFEGLGKIQNSYKIRLKENSVPFAVSTPRRLALPLKGKVKAELEKLEKQEVIRPVTQPTDWCAPIVAVPKSNGKVRLCVDLTKLNESVRRENFPLPSTDQLLAQLSGAKVFSKLDCNSGFYQIPLDEDSQLLTTFITPFGRYCYTRLPFGISSGPEVFQRTMTQLLSGQSGVICDIDDLLIYGRNQKEHDDNLDHVLRKLENAGVTLNAEKCQFSKETIKFLGHVVSRDGIAIDPDKVAAIKNFPRPANISDLRRLLGMVNHVSKFAGSTLSEDVKPLRDLLKKDNDWSWDSMQETAFQNIKTKLMSAPVLAHYSPDRKTVVSADASSYGLGAVLFQKQTDETLKPVFYASRSMTPTEQRYAQVEKEALAATWACEKFSVYITGLADLTIETDHKPLLALLKTKNLDELTPRIQRFRMRLMRYLYKIVYTQGKNLITADALSRAPTQEPGETEKKLEEEGDLLIHQVIGNLPATERRLEEIRKETGQDPLCETLKKYTQEGWPYSCPEEKLKAFWAVRHEISIHEGLLLYGSRIIIPETLRKDVLQKVHAGHQGIVKCRALARESVWWPGLSSQIETMVTNCPTCMQERKVPPEPLIPTQTPDFPWQKVGMDLFDFKGDQYLLVIDYYSRFIELAHLKNEKAITTIAHIKSIFSRHGVPQSVMTDNGPQFKNEEFRKFASTYGFDHTTSSPYYPPANGEAERAVETVKNLLKKADDPYIAIMMYRATPLQIWKSPAELLMGRKIRTIVPSISRNFMRKSQGSLEVAKADAEQKMKMNLNFDRAHHARVAPELVPGQQGVIPKTLPFRSYEVQTPSGSKRRNRHLVPRDLAATRDFQTPGVSSLIPVQAQHPGDVSIPQAMPEPVTASDPVPVYNQVYTRSGRPVKKPDRLDI